MTSEEKAAADREYADQVAANPESSVDGVYEAPEETAGIAGARRAIMTGLIVLVSLVVGAGLAIGYDWWTTRPTPKTQTLSQAQYDVLWRAADPGNRGYNDTAIGALRGIGYKPVAQQADDRMRQYFIILVKCPGDAGYLSCATGLRPNPDPVIYLGLGKELKDGHALARFNPELVMVDLQRDDGGTQRCTLRDGQAGEPGTITYTLNQTVDRLKAVFANRTTEDPDGESLDNLSYWTCVRQ